MHTYCYSVCIYFNMVAKLAIATFPAGSGHQVKGRNATRPTKRRVSLGDPIAVDFGYGRNWTHVGDECRRPIRPYLTCDVQDSPAG